MVLLPACRSLADSTDKVNELNRFAQKISDIRAVVPTRRNPW